MTGSSHPKPSLLARPFLALIWAYRVTLSPLLGGQCRFTPTCSQYALDAFRTLSWPRACWLVARRLCRCHPWGGSGFDPIKAPEDGSA